MVKDVARVITGLERKSIAWQILFEVELVAANDYALLVGIQRYPGIRDLGGPENDVNEIAHWLIDPQGGDVPRDQITTIVSSAFPSNGDMARPVLDDLHQFFAMLFLKQLSKQQQDGSPQLGRRLYLFLSGHGFHASELSQAALCMANSNASINNYPHLGGQVYADNIANHGMFEEVFLWMDCCRQTIPSLTVNRPTWPPRVPPIPPRRFFWAFATGSGALAAEAEMEVRGVRKAHGIFTALFLDALEKCKTRMGGQVCASDIASYIGGGMKRVLGPTAPEPQFQTDPLHDMVLFHRTKNLTVARFKIPGAAAGTLTLTTGQDEPALPGPVPISQEAASTELEPGIYKAVVDGTGRFALFTHPSVSDVTIT